MVLGHPDVRAASAVSGPALGSGAVSLVLLPWCRDCEVLLEVLLWVDAAKLGLWPYSAWPATVL